MYVKRIERIKLIEDYGFIECSVSLRNRTTTFIRGRMISNYDIHPVFKMSLYYKFSNGEYRKFLIDVTEDVCGLLKGRKSAPLLNLVWHYFKNYTNIRRCPLKKVK